MRLIKALIRSIATTLHLGWILLVVLTPLLGVWLASSLASFFDGPRWAAVAAGAVLFPILPLAWEARAERRFRRKRADGKRILTLTDRVVLRTLVVNLAFTGVLLGALPAQSFTALATRGDWFLDDVDHALVPDARKGLFFVAENLEFLYKLARPNPYEIDVGEEPSPEPKRKGRLAEKDDAPTPAPGEPATASCGPGVVGCRPTWPFEATLHPAVRDMPPEAEASIRTVGEYLKAKEPNPYFRVKAIHDYVADRIAYDAPALARNEYPPYEPEIVFQRRTGVCAGYAMLVQAIGEVTGDKFVYVVGNTRELDGEIAGVSHAWNAVEIEGAWYLLDSTWNSGSVDGDRFVKKYSTAYFLPPADVMGLDHFPERTEWQLRETPITRGEFLRQPMLSPNFYAEGLRLVRPDRAQVEVATRLDLEIQNPKSRSILATMTPEGSDPSGGTQCEAGQRRATTVSCQLPASGRWSVNIFTAQQEEAPHSYVGKLEVVARGQ